MKNVYDIIRRPVITEQSMEAVADKKYVFMVDVDANKTEIKAAVEQAFGVKVAKVNTIRMQGRSSAPVPTPPASGPPTRRLSLP